MILATIQRRNTTRQQDVQNFRYKIVLSNLVLREKTYTQLYAAFHWIKQS